MVSDKKSAVILFFVPLYEMPFNFLFFFCVQQSEYMPRGVCVCLFCLVFSELFGSVVWCLLLLMDNSWSLNPQGFSSALFFLSSPGVPITSG